jgi:hypothetical protein
MLTCRPPGVHISFQQAIDEAIHLKMATWLQLKLVSNFKPKYSLQIDAIMLT